MFLIVVIPLIFVFITTSLVNLNLKREGKSSRVPPSSVFISIVLIYLTTYSTLTFTHLTTPLNVYIALVISLLPVLIVLLKNN